MKARLNPQTGEKLSETLVRFLVEDFLGVRVCCYDDRRGVSRPDALIHRVGGVPLEIVSDPLVSELQLASALRRIRNRTKIPGIQRGYIVCLSDQARVDDLGWLQATLHRLEDPATRRLVASRTSEYQFIRPVLSLAAGEVRFTTGHGGGRSIPQPRDVITEASAILARAEYADVGRKLGAYGGVERHAALVVDEDKTPAFSWLRVAQPADVNGLPAPELPEEITHLWITPRNGRGLTAVWSPSIGWQGKVWRWGHVTEALEAWHDVTCTQTHTPHPTSTRVAD